MPTQKRKKAAAPNDDAIQRQLEQAPAAALEAKVSSQPPSVRDLQLHHLTSTLSEIREEGRSQQLLFFPTLVLAITIPLSTIAAERLEILHHTFSIWITIRPAWFILLSWVVGVVLMGRGLLLLSEGADTATIIDLEDMATFLADNQGDEALESLKTAFNREFRRLQRIKKARSYLFWAFALFILTVLIQFGMVLLITSFDAPPTTGLLIM